MPANATKHPSAAALKAYGMGKLSGAEEAAIRRHLERCSDCNGQMAALSGDSLLHRLQDAHARGGTSLPPKPLSGVAHSLQTTRPAGSAPAIPNLPPELANNRQYEVLRELGRGGMGVVYLARNVLMDRPEVLKVLNKALLDKPGAADRFLREIRSASKLSHDFVVKAYSALQLGELLVFAMEYVEGEDLAKVVKKDGRLPVANACFFAYQAALGLQHAHEHGMVHRDIKPHNLILTREGQRQVVKVLDFGLAKATREKQAARKLTKLGTMMGTPDYIAPEQILDAARADIRADIYSLGCTLYFLLTGSPPFQEKTLDDLLQAHISREATPLNKVRGEVPADLAAVVAKMMAKDPARRYQTPVEVAQALAPFVRITGKAAPGEAPEARTDSTSVPSKVHAVGSAVKGARQAKQGAPEAVPGHQKTLTEGSSTASGARKKVIETPRPRAPKSAVSKRWPAVAVTMACALLLGVVVLWGAGVFSGKTALQPNSGDSPKSAEVGTKKTESDREQPPGQKDGILVVEVNEPDADVFVDGGKMPVTWADGGKKAEIPIKPGARKTVEFKKGGFTTHTEVVEIKEGERRVLVVELIPSPLDKNGLLEHVKKGSRWVGWSKLTGKWGTKDYNGTPRDMEVIVRDYSGGKIEFEYWSGASGGVLSSGARWRGTIDGDGKINATPEEILAGEAPSPPTEFIGKSFFLGKISGKTWTHNDWVGDAHFEHNVTLLEYMEPLSIGSTWTGETKKTVPAPASSVATSFTITGCDQGHFTGDLQSKDGNFVAEVQGQVTGTRISSWRYTKVKRSKYGTNNYMTKLEITQGVLKDNTITFAWKMPAVAEMEQPATSGDVTLKLHSRDPLGEGSIWEGQYRQIKPPNNTCDITWTITKRYGDTFEGLNRHPGIETSFRGTVVDGKVEVWITKFLKGTRGSKALDDEFIATHFSKGTISGDEIRLDCKILNGDDDGKITVRRNCWTAGSRWVGVVTKKKIVDGKAAIIAEDFRFTVLSRKEKEFTAQANAANGQYRAEIEGTVEGRTVRFHWTKDSLGNIGKDLIENGEFEGKLQGKSMEGTTTKRTDPSYQGKGQWTLVE